MSANVADYKLFSPIGLAQGLALKNRIVFGPCTRVVPISRPGCPTAENANEEVQSLSRHLANVIVEGEAPTPFIVLENSSGTGKTQMAFNLQARGECDVFYIVCGKPGDREQSVYSAYAERTVTFRDCVSTDLGTMEKKSRGNHDSLGAVGEIRGRTTLALYGFILAALRGSELYCGEAQRSDVQDELIRRKERGAKPFVFFLDEFPRAGSTKTHLDDKEQRERENYLRTMRNVFRSFDLAVVVSSTNGTARNLLATSDRSRDSGPCLCGSRDLNDYLNAMAGTLASRFGALKKRTDEFKIGQLCLLLCTSYHVLDDK
ncbi:P-loop containing nucleoside triphosphate hydrolase [Phytophthora cactorum]|nr:P-loop containing nucleoside triphosphate hydrolase [Phytophthora cactorum]